MHVGPDIRHAYIHAHVMHAYYYAKQDECTTSKRSNRHANTHEARELRGHASTMTLCTNTSSTLGVWDGKYGDRQQELVITGLGLDEPALRSALENCALTPQEMTAEEAGHVWPQLPDPWPEWVPLDIVDDSAPAGCSMEPNTRNFLAFGKGI